MKHPKNCSAQNPGRCDSPAIRNSSFHGRRLFAEVLGLLLIGEALNLRGAPITWSAATNISSDTDVVTTGALAYLYSWATFSTNVNGVPFDPLRGYEGGTNIFFSTQMSIDGGDFTTTFTPFAALSPAYRSILVGAIFLASPTNISVGMTFSNLTVGHNYLVQAWVCDPRGPENARSETINRGGNSVLLKFSVNGGMNPGGPGQYTVGTFKADANVQAITLTSDTNNVVELNAIQVRDTSVSGLPALDKIKASGPAAMQIIFHGPFGEHYTLLSTTNITTPMTNWQVLPNGIGTFDTTFVTNIDSAATNRDQFYRVRSP